MSEIWFTSDTHFGSQRTLELSQRPFKTVEEMDKILIENWNSVVGKNDIVYHLGDFGNYNTVKQLNGNIVLIYGNYELKDRIKREDLIEYGFNDAEYNPTRRKINNIFLNLSHLPSESEKRININEFNLFGHIHKLQMVKKFGLNVGTDCHNFYPINIETVMFYKNAIDNFYDSEVFMQ